MSSYFFHAETHHPRHLIRCAHPPSQHVGGGAAESGHGAGLPNLILTHFSPRHHSPEEQAGLLAEVQAHYRGRAFMAADGDVFVLGADGSVQCEP